MATTITWDDGSGNSSVFTVPDDVFSSLDKFRQSSNMLVQVYDPTTRQMVPRYAAVKDMIVGVFVQTLVMPALAQFPTPSIQTAVANLAVAQAALAAAQTQALPGFAGHGTAPIAP